MRLVHFMLVWLLAVSACSVEALEPCSSETCSGCCQPDGACRPGNDVLACGELSACQVCTGGEACMSGRCTAPDAGAGPSDAGSGDAGTIMDAGVIDAGAVDAGSVDAGPVDAGSADAGSVDAGAVDAGSVDAGPVDAGCAPGSSCAINSLCSAARVCEWDVADLAALVVLPGPIAFDPQQTDYVLVQDPQVTDVTVIATLPAGARASLTVGVSSAMSGSPVIVSLTGVSTTVPVTVRAESGRSRTYRVVIHRVALPSAQASYVKASNAGSEDRFGRGLVLSGDGTTLAVGAVLEDTGIINSGAVYVFVRADAGWAQQAMLKVDAGSGSFGESLAIAESGDVLVVGSPTQTVGGVTGAGLAHVFRRSASTWEYATALDNPQTSPQQNDFVGRGLSISADAGVIAVGVPGERGACVGVDPSFCPRTAAAAGTGAVLLFTASGSTWALEHFLKASNAEAFDGFGSQLALSSDGTTLAVSAPYEASNGTSQADNSVVRSGAVYVFTRAGASWTQQAWLKASNPGEYDQFGEALSLSGDGATLAVGAPYEESAGTGPYSPLQSDNSALHAGAVYVFTRTTSGWPQSAYLKASNTDVADVFGRSVSLNRNGTVLAVGAPGEDSGGTGVNSASQADDTRDGSGAAYVFALLQQVWEQTAYVKASNADPGDFFGFSTALSADGATLICGATGESSIGYDFNGTPAQQNNAALNAGAVYVFSR